MPDVEDQAAARRMAAICKYNADTARTMAGCTLDGGSGVDIILEAARMIDAGELEEEAAAAKILEDVEVMLEALEDTELHGPVHAAIAADGRIVCTSQAMADAVLEACPDAPVEVVADAAS